MAEGSGLLLEARSVRACYESVEVLHGIDLRIEPGSTTAILGPNGAGKSTLLSVLAGLHEASAGEVHFDGKPVKTNKADKLVRDGLCLIPEGKGIFPNLTVQENLWMMSHGGRSRREIEEKAFERFPQLSSRRNQTAGTLSGGEQQMLAMVRAVSTKPRLLMLDELSMGLAPIIVDNLYEVVASLAADGMTVVVVEQFAEYALKVATWAVVMTGGRVVHAGPSSDVGRASTSCTWAGTPPTATTPPDGSGAGSDGPAQGLSFVEEVDDQLSLLRQHLGVLARRAVPVSLADGAHDCPQPFALRLDGAGHQHEEGPGDEADMARSTTVMRGDRAASTTVAWKASASSPNRNRSSVASIWWLSAARRSKTSGSARWAARRAASP